VAVTPLWGIYLDVGDSGKLIARPSGLRCQSENGQKSDVDPGDNGVDADPKGHPRQDDEQHTWDVVLDQEVAEVATDDEDHLQARNFTRRVRWNSPSA